MRGPHVTNGMGRTQRGGPKRKLGLSFGDGVIGKASQLKKKSQERNQEESISSFTRKLI